MPSPYRIVGPACINFSGGRTSGKMLYEILNEHDGQLPPDVYVCFENTGEESEPTYKFILQCSHYWNVPVIWLEYEDTFNVEDYRKKDGTLSERRLRGLSVPKVVTYETAARKGEPFDKMLRYFAEYRRVVKGLPPVLPNAAQRMCTSYLKIKTNRNYMWSLGYDDFEAITGIRRDEPRRYARMMKANESRSDGFEYNLPLYIAGVVKSDVNQFWREQPFDLELDAESHEGNCRYCILKKDSKLIQIMRKDIAANDGAPTEAIWRMVDREAATGQTFRKPYLPNYSALLQIALSGGEVRNDDDEPVIDCICGEP